jgi:RNA polymerase sigma-70 factor (ECF subfamily)
MSGSAPLSDEELVRLVREGDQSAARLLFDRHLPELRARARSRLPASLRGRVGGSDVVQEAYLAAFRSIDEFEDRGAGSFAAWLRAIVEHRIAKQVRDGVSAAKRDPRREKRIPTGTGGAGAAPGQSSPSEDAMAEEEAACVRAARESLSPDHRMVISLVHDEGLTLAKAGERMGRSAEAARKLYSRAFAELAARLGTDRERDP